MRWVGCRVIRVGPKLVLTTLLFTLSPSLSTSLSIFVFDSLAELQAQE